jgi:Dynamin family
MNFQQAEQTAIVLADGLENMARVVSDQLGLMEEADKLKLRAEQIRADRFRVVVVGEFKRGKSTLLNALLGADLLPQKMSPCTAVVTAIRYGDQPAVEVLFADGSPVEVLSPGEFRARYELQVEDAAAAQAEDFDRFSRVDYAVIHYPLELCRHRVELVDSPGLGEHQTRTLRTQSFLNRADAIVMVLAADHLVAQEEEQFLDNIVLPRGLRNIFFIVNKWNLIEQNVLSSEKLEEEYAGLNARIRLKLTPFCVINGKDRSEERIFRVNALGALRARLRKPNNFAALEESCVPAFEAGLQRFLVEDRGKVRSDVALAAMKAVTTEVNRFIDAQFALAGRSLAEMEAEMVALQPNLDRLRGIKKHIEGFLDVKSTTLQDLLVASFQEVIRKIEMEIPEAVDGFGLDELTRGSMILKALTDWFKHDDHKFARKVENHLRPQVERFFEKHLAVWHLAVVQNVMPEIAQDIETHLQEEAAEYQRVMREIEDRLGIQHTVVPVKEMVAHWLGNQNMATGSHPVHLSGMGVGLLGDLSWLTAGVVTDIIMHTTAVLIPFIGLIITGFRLYFREKSIRDDMKMKLVNGLRDKLDEIVCAQTSTIRDEIRKGFDGLRQKVSNSIGGEIALVEASLQSLLDRKRDREYSMEQERVRLEKARAEITTIMSQVREDVLAHSK